jgi:hypothetical protein
MVVYDSSSQPFSYSPSADRQRFLMNLLPDAKAAVGAAKE